MDQSEFRDVGNFSVPERPASYGNLDCMMITSVLYLCHESPHFTPNKAGGMRLQVRENMTRQSNNCAIDMVAKKIYSHFR